jgi:hypothetical protein
MAGRDVSSFADVLEAAQERVRAESTVSYALYPLGAADLAALQAEAIATVRGLAGGYVWNCEDFRLHVQGRRPGEPLHGAA